MRNIRYIKWSTTVCISPDHFSFSSWPLIASFFPLWRCAFSPPLFTAEMIHSFGTAELCNNLPWWSKLSQQPGGWPDEACGPLNIYHATWKHKSLIMASKNDLYEYVNNLTREHFVWSVWQTCQAFKWKWLTFGEG